MGGGDDGHTLGMGLRVCLLSALVEQCLGLGSQQANMGLFGWAAIPALVCIRVCLVESKRS